MQLTYQTYGERKNDWLVGISGVKHEINTFFNLAHNYGSIDTELIWKTDNFARFITTKEQMEDFLVIYYEARYGGNRKGCKNYVKKYMDRIKPGKVA